MTFRWDFPSPMLRESRKNTLSLQNSQVLKLTFSSLPNVGHRFRLVSVNSAWHFGFWEVLIWRLKHLSFQDFDCCCDSFCHSPLSLFNYNIILYIYLWVISLQTPLWSTSVTWSTESGLVLGGTAPASYCFSINVDKMWEHTYVHPVRLVNLCKFAQIKYMVLWTWQLGTWWNP